MTTDTIPVAELPYARLAVEIVLREQNAKPGPTCGPACCHWSVPIGIKAMDYPSWIAWHWHALIHQQAREG